MTSTTEPGSTTGPGSTTEPGSTTTAPGSVVTIVGGPNATANAPGPQSDPADFYGIGLALAVILVAIVITRLVFRRPGGGAGDAEGPR